MRFYVKSSHFLPPAKSLVKRAKIEKMQKVEAQVFNIL